MSDLPRDLEWERNLVAIHAQAMAERNQVSNGSGSPKVPQPSAEIFHGLPGRLAQLISEYVESDQASVLVQLLTGFGIAVGIRPHLMVGATRHAPALYTGLVGRTSRGRKGTGWDPVEALLTRADLNLQDRIRSGLGSGEMLVHLVHDAVLDEHGHEIKPAAKDRRLLLREAELSRLLVIVNREGSTLSHLLREAFDGKPLHNAVKRDPASSSVHHVGLVGHVTVEELRDTLTERQVRNGLANRIGWFISTRAQRLAQPPIFEGHHVDEAATELAEALHFAREIQRMNRSRRAEDMWAEWYNQLPDDEVGVVAAITNRAEALVARWSMVYALMDRDPIVNTQHLYAAIALYEYELACVEHIFGGTTGDPMADRVLTELEYGSLSQSELYEIFSGHVSASVLERIGHELEKAGRIERYRIRGSGSGRPALYWRLR